MTHPPATCELCGGTGLYSPSALPCPKGCKEFDIVESLKFIGSMSLDQDAARLSYQAAEYVSNLQQYISELEQREKDARGKALDDAAEVAEILSRKLANDAQFCHKNGLLKTAASSLLQSEGASKSAGEVRALKDEVR